MKKPFLLLMIFAGCFFTATAQESSLHDYKMGINLNHTFASRQYDEMKMNLRSNHIMIMPSVFFKAKNGNIHHTGFDLLEITSKHVWDEVWNLGLFYQYQYRFFKESRVQPYVSAAAKFTFFYHQHSSRSYSNSRGVVFRPEINPGVAIHLSRIIVLHTEILIPFTAFSYSSFYINDPALQHMNNNPELHRQDIFFPEPMSLHVSLGFKIR